MAQVITTTFQLRRGNAEVWERNNPVLSRGEPGFVIDENRLKIGDGVTPWNELDYIGEDIFNAATAGDFPLIGESKVIYRAEQEKSLYQWNSAESKYELLSVGETIVEEIKTQIKEIKENFISKFEVLEIYGGSASDNI